MDAKLNTVSNLVAMNNGVNGKADHLRRTFNLTPAESDLAALLLDDMTLAEIGTLLDKRITTLRTQLRALFNKTGTRRQATLVLRLQSAVDKDS